MHEARTELHRVTREAQGVNTEDVQNMKQKLRRISKQRRRCLRKWENDWWKDLGQNMSEASHRGDQAEMYKILNELKVRHEGRRDTGKNVSEDPDKEREAWKDHFAKISEEEGEVHNRVWANVSEGKEWAHWLGEPPTDIELDKCVSKMNNKRRPGKDKFVAELLKYGGKHLRKKVYQTVREMWKRAAEAEDGEEGEQWPPSWRIGLVVPLWKKKGKKSDKNTWRGVTLLSVGAKLMARLVAMCMQQWSETWLDESQNGFRRGRGVDDALTVTRRIIEEVCRAGVTSKQRSKEWVLMSFFDIMKAYPRVCRKALWKLLEHKKCDMRMIKVCKALHNFCNYCIINKIHSMKARMTMRHIFIKNGNIFFSN